MPADDILARTLDRIDKKIDHGFSATHSRIDQLVAKDAEHTATLGVVSQRLSGQEEEMKDLKKKVESRSVPPKSSPPYVWTPKAIAAGIALVVTALGGGGVAAVNNFQEQQERERIEQAARDRAEREAFARLARALAESNRAQGAGAEAMATLDPYAAEQAKNRAAIAEKEALKAADALSNTEE